MQLCKEMLSFGCRVLTEPKPLKNSYICAFECILSKCLPKLHNEATDTVSSHTQKARRP